MFEALTEKLGVAFGRLSNKGRLIEKDVDQALRAVHMFVWGEFAFQTVWGTSRQSSEAAALDRDAVAYSFFPF